VRKKFGVHPERIPDYLALVGDASDGYPGLPGVGPKTAAQLVSRYGPLERFPDEAFGGRREQALLFKQLATLRTDAPLFRAVDELRWLGPTPGFGAWTQRLGDARLLDRARKAEALAASL
jgi:5'-3' exonuclease